MDEPIKWSPRVRKAQLHRLYQSEAAGHLDEGLLDEVGMMLLCRCEDILTVARAVAGHVRCPRCAAHGRPTIIHRDSGKPETLMVCPACDWRMTWGDYRRTFQRKQLHIGGARAAFEAFIEGWPRAREGRQKMLLVDRLIHEFHYSLRDRPTLPTRAAGVNLIEGKLTDVVAFLDALSAGLQDPALTEDHQQWRQRLDEAQQAWHHPK